MHGCGRACMCVCACVRVCMCMSCVTAFVLVRAYVTMDSAYKTRHVSTRVTILLTSNYSKRVVFCLKAVVLR